MSRQSEAKTQQGYNPKPEPAHCANCAHYKSDRVGSEGWDKKIYYEEKNIRCGIGGFAVKKRGVCNEHVPNILLTD